MSELTQTQFDALVKLLRADRRSNRYKIALQVMVNSVEIAEAARLVGTSYNAAHQAVKGYRNGLELAKIAAGITN